MLLSLVLSLLILCVYFNLIDFVLILLYFTLLYFTLLYFTLLYFTVLYFTLFIMFCFVYHFFAMQEDGDQSPLSMREGTCQPYLQQQYDQSTHFPEYIQQEPDKVLVGTLWSGSLPRLQSYFNPNHVYYRAFSTRIPIVALVVFVAQRKDMPHQAHLEVLVGQGCPCGCQGRVWPDGPSLDSGCQSDAAAGRTFVAEGGKREHADPQRHHCFEELCCVRRGMQMEAHISSFLSVIMSLVSRCSGLCSIYVCLQLWTVS